MTAPVDANLSAELAATGFLFLGGFEPGPEDGVPSLSGGGIPKSLMLVGSTGPSLWPLFKKSAEFSDGTGHPLDRYTKRVLTECALKHGVEPIFPFEGPPYFPFQQWALRCGGFSQSPLGVLAHHTFGPWTGFRAVFLSWDISDETSATKPGPCETCLDKPCLTACPVNAISVETGYDVPACKAHITSHDDIACWSGCLARHACPFGTQHRPEAETARFHMKSFTGLT